MSIKREKVVKAFSQAINGIHSELNGIHRDELAVPYKAAIASLQRAKELEQKVGEFDKNIIRIGVDLKKRLISILI